MNKTFAFFLVATSCKLSKAEELTQVSFDQPLKKIEVKSEINSIIKLTCWIYDQSLVLQLVDSNSMGAQKIAILEKRNQNKKGESNLESLCKEAGLKNGRILNSPYGYYSGRIKSNFFVQEPDSFGNQQRFFIYDEDGSKVFEDLRDTEIPLKIVNRNPLELDYYQTLPIECPIVLEPTKCWTEVVKKYKIPKDLDLKIPECKEAYLKEKSKFENWPVLSTRVTVNKRNNKFKKTFLGGVVRCRPAP